MADQRAACVLKTQFVQASADVLRLGWDQRRCTTACARFRVLHGSTVKRLVHRCVDVLFCSASMVHYYTTDYWPGMHTTMFSVVDVTTRTQRETFLF